MGGTCVRDGLLPGYGGQDESWYGPASRWCTGCSVMHHAAFRSTAVDMWGSACPLTSSTAAGAWSAREAQPVLSNTPVRSSLWATARRSGDARTVSPAAGTRPVTPHLHGTVAVSLAFRASTPYAEAVGLLHPVAL